MQTTARCHVCVLVVSLSPSSCWTPMLVRVSTTAVQCSVVSTYTMRTNRHCNSLNCFPVLGGPHSLLVIRVVDKTVSIKLCSTLLLKFKQNLTLCLLFRVKMLAVSELNCSLHTVHAVLSILQQLLVSMHLAFGSRFAQMFMSNHLHLNSIFMDSCKVFKT